MSTNTIIQTVITYVAYLNDTRLSLLSQHEINLIYDPMLT